MILRLAMIGFGNVGREFAKMLLLKKEWLLKKKGLDVEVLAIATKTRGSLLSKRGLDLVRVLSELEGKGHLRDYGPEVTNLPPLRIIEECDADMMIELTPLNIKTGQPAIDHISSALQAGIEVVTANKGPLAHAYDMLMSTARSRNVHFRFEGTVMDGTPIFSLVEKTLPGCEIRRIEGILNSTSNFVLAEMARGRTMEDAIHEAQVRGFAEADPSLDIDGWDAAAKITALANVLMGARMKPSDVKREGIREVTVKDIAEAQSSGKKIKMVARAERRERAVELSVQNELIGPDQVFWAVDGTTSAVTISTDLMGDLTIVESNPAVTQTAYAVFSDMLLIVDSIRSGTL